ncbi:ATP-binding cassette domain-containing protein [Candidatus Peregrinibacteria bacterium]|nr:ATP-binding cassette domain-containing protein [Candidatus Peregrinibacteria bacterium]
MISVKKLQKTFSQDIARPGFFGSLQNLFHREKRSVEAVKEISFEIREGEFVGFLGPNGAGKTTTLKMLSGILNPTSGAADVLGFTPWKREKKFQKQFSLIMGQKNQLWWDLPVIESFHFNRAVYEIPPAVYETQKEKLTELLGIASLLPVQVRKLSLGERMKCELAAALLHKPKVLFLDEPTIGLDVISQKSIRDFLAAYNREEKATILLTSHYMEDIRRLCRRVMIIDLGKLIYDGDYRDLVEKFADTKTIEITLAQTMPRSDLERFGIVADFRDTFVRLIVARKRVSEVTTELLKRLPVEDISIHEETMEEIVRGIFLNHGR